MSASDFDKKRVIVTGAGKGIGRQLALTLARTGATVFAISKTESGLVSLKNEDPRIETHCQDISKWDETRALLTHIGPVHMLVNNAAIHIPVPALDTSQEQYDRLMDINVKAVFNITQVVTSQMVENDIEGSVVNVSSLTSKYAFKDALVYCSSKAALDMMTKCFALELGRKGIRLNTVNPTIVNTAMGKLYMDLHPKMREYFENAIPSGRIVEEQEVVDCIMFLLGSGARNVNGVSLPVDGGQHVQCMSIGQ